jgi:hypothetical protein
VSGRWRRLVDRGRGQVERIAATLRVAQAPSQRPLPRVRIALGAWVPGWVLRLVQALVALSCVALVHPGSGVWFLGALSALLLVLRPSGLVAACFVVFLGFRLAVTPAEPYAASSFLLLFGVHLLVQLARAGSAVPWSARVELQVLVPTALRFVRVQALAQLLALGAAALTARSLALPWVPVLVGAALTVLGWRLLSLLVSNRP